VQLRNCAGLWIKGTTTTSNGRYQFDGLAGGNYMIRFAAPNGARFTRIRAGTDETADSNADSSGWTQCTNVPANGVRQAIDAGLVY
jgi:hypothetical protein